MAVVYLAHRAHWSMQGVNEIKPSNFGICKQHYKPRLHPLPHPLRLLRPSPLYPRLPWHRLELHLKRSVRCPRLRLSAHGQT